MASALCHGAASIIAAFATGKGGAFGIDLWTKANVELSDSPRINAQIKGSPKEDTRLAELCVRNTLRHFGFKYGAKVETESNIPIAAGLKSSSVAANAVVLATLGALAEKHGEVRKVRLSKTESRQELFLKNKIVEPVDLINIGVDSALQAKVTVTGAYDDACASYFGGYVITDNRERTIARRGDMENLSVVILLPERRIYTKKADLSRISSIKNSVDAAWNLALEGQLYTAVTLNGFMHSLAFNLDSEAAMKALDAGAIAAGLSGKGPAVVALARGNVKKIVKAWKGIEGKVIEAKTNNIPAMIIA
jgi:shikimate kinase